MYFYRVSDSTERFERGFVAYENGMAVVLGADFMRIATVAEFVKNMSGAPPEGFEIIEKSDKRVHFRSKIEPAGLYIYMMIDESADGGYAVMIFTTEDVY